MSASPRRCRKPWTTRSGREIAHLARCAWWVKQRWLDTEMSDSGVRYRLSPYSLRALRFVREIAEGESTVSGARLGSIAHAVRRLADMTSSDRMAQARRIDEEIAELRRRKQEVLEGRAGTATVTQLREQLHEVLTMTRSLPADFRQLRSMVEDRHKVIAREALAETPKADMVESYLHENDLLANTPEGVAYRRFAVLQTAPACTCIWPLTCANVAIMHFARRRCPPCVRERGPPGRRITRTATDIVRTIGWPAIATLTLIIDRHIPVVSRGYSDAVPPASDSIVSISIDTPR